MKFFEKIRKYHFQLRHVIVLFIILMFFQLTITFIHKISLGNFLVKTQDWYQKDSAEKLANLTATSLELLLENTPPNLIRNEEERRRIIQAFNIILSQQILQQHVEDICVLVGSGDAIIAIDNGQALYDYLFAPSPSHTAPERPHDQAVAIYRLHQEQIRGSEQIYTQLEGRQTFHVFVPFVPRGEYTGAVYMKNAPDFAFITDEIITSYTQSTLIFMALIFIGLLAMVYISSYTLRERDEVQALLYREREHQLKQVIQHQKEALFTKRIYHTHHKAEKVMGFIKEDLRTLERDTIDEVKYRVTQYANFISRVIYDMKWYDPPLQTIRNPMFRTDLNEVIRFIVSNIFQRVAVRSDGVRFELDLERGLPPITVNEFVVWEILEPLIQNSIEHGEATQLVVTITTRYRPENRTISLFIADNGAGILPALLQTNAGGIKRIFLENTSTKENSQNTGYGCYIAHEIAVQRCGWKLDVVNLAPRGCRFSIDIPLY